MDSYDGMSYGYWQKGDVDRSDQPDQDGAATRALMDFSKTLSKAVSKETSSDPENWSLDNPFYGHCAVVALLVQERFGGYFLRASLEKVSGYEQMRSHYWNQLTNYAEVDLTASQFKGDDRKLVPEGELVGRDGKPITREYLLANPDTKRRYETLKERFQREESKRYPGVKLE